MCWATIRSTTLTSLLRNKPHFLELYTRGGSRVVQVISRNHSNVSKPAFVTPQVLYCSPRNQLFFSLFRQSHSIPGPFRANSTSVRLRGFVLCRYFREQCEKTRKHDRRKFFPVGGTVWFMDRLAKTVVQAAHL